MSNDGDGYSIDKDGYNWAWFPLQDQDGTGDGLFDRCGNGYEITYQNYPYGRV